MEPHDIHDFVVSAQRIIEDEYERIQKRSAEDPGTAGDQGEENWASLFKQWLPSYFHVVTKGRILTDSGYASPQIDVLVLVPSYPSILLDKKLYLSGGVVAAFECKTTVTANDVKQAVQTAGEIQRNLPKKTGSPYVEINSPIIYGLISHSHSWKGEHSKPIENIDNALFDADSQYVKHPIECIDLICVADLGTWTVAKLTFFGPIMSAWTSEMVEMYGPKGSATSSYICSAIGRTFWTIHFHHLACPSTHYSTKKS